MSPEEFRRFAHESVDWIADYLSHPERYPVLPRIEPGQLADALPASGPDLGEPMDRLLEDFRRLVVPAITHWNHPGFMAYFANTAPGPGIIAELLAAALNANAMLWKTSPAATELEQVVLDWLRQWMGLPDGVFGIIYDTASTSSMHAIAAAREMADPEARTLGASRGLTLYCSEEAHSSIEKGAIAIGVGQQYVRKIPVDEEFRMRPAALEAAVEADIAAGLRPFCVVATVGTTSTTSIDPVPAIADIAARHRLWLHVDAAYAGSAAIVPEFRHILNGAERADSLVVNPHKWFFTPFDLSAFYTRRPDILRRAFSLVPEYLRTAQDGRAVNYMDYGVPLGRRFRALKAMVRDALFRARKAGGNDSPADRLGARIGRRRGRRPAFRAERTRTAFRGLLPLQGNGRRESPPAGGSQRGGRVLPVAHRAARKVHAAPGDREHGHYARARHAGVGDGAPRGARLCGRGAPGLIE